MNIERILEEYRNGDEKRRLSLFFSFRELRDFFIRIEQESAQADFIVIRFPWSRRHRALRAA